jgi:hypothetical protein
MSVSSAPEPIDAAMAEYMASFESGWAREDGRQVLAQR